MIRKVVGLVSHKVDEVHPSELEGSEELEWGCK